MSLARLRFAAIGLQEFETRRRRKEEIPNLNACTEASSRRPRVRHIARLDLDREGCLLPAWAAGDLEAADPGKRSKRLTSKAEAVDTDQIVIRKLGRRMGLDGEPEFVRRHTDAIIGDSDQPLAACLELDGNARRLSVDSVLNQLLYRGRRPLDHFAGCDAVDDVRWQDADHGWRALCLG